MAVFEKRVVRDVEVVDKVVLVRVDYNVPLGEDGSIKDDLRIRASLPTLQDLLGRGARKVIVMAHLGRPEGVDPKLSLRGVAERLGELLRVVEVGFVPATVGDEVSAAAESLPDGSVLVLENLRFDPREEENSEEFAREIVLATDAELFVQDGFGAVHRAHASTDAICRIIPSVAGLLLEKEVSNLAAVREPQSPSVMILGGAKVDDKAPLVDKLADVYDTVMIGGKLANEYTPSAENAVMPVDFELGEDGVAYDMGEKSAAAMVGAICGAQTVLWNGVVGKTEEPQFANGSMMVARAMGEQHGALTVVCGGDTTAFVEKLQQAEPGLEYSLVSTGGGAALEFLLEESLPGVEALENA